MSPRRVEPTDRPDRPDRRRRIAQSLALLAGPMGLPAAALDRPAGPVVLTVHGKVRSTNADNGADFDMKMLERMPQTSFSTRTPWYAGPRRFSGPLLRDVLSAAGASGTLLRVTALNDYRVDIPVDDALRHELIVALLLDGKPMAVRDKGPLFLIYPFDTQPELRTATYYSRSAWQLRSIQVL